MVNSVHRLEPGWPAAKEPPGGGAPPPPPNPPSISLDPASSTRLAPRLDIDARRCGSAVTLLHRVLPERKADLVKLLERMGKNIDGTQEIPFNSLQTVHFLRWVVVDGATGGEPAQLMFESNYDGTLDQHLGELLTRGAQGMHEIYRCCEGYPAATSAQLEDGQHASVLSFVKTGQLPYQAFYVGRRGKSAQRIQLEGQLREAIQKFLQGFGSDPLPSLGGTPRAAYDAIVAHLKATHAEELQRLSELVAAGPPPPQRSVLLDRLRGVAERLGQLPPHVLLLLGLPLALPLAPVVLPLLAPYLWLRQLEQTDVSLQLDVSPDQTRELAQREDFQVQNQLTHLVAVKPGAFRQLLLRTVLGSINLLGKVYFNQGDLGGLATIHYARWVLIDGGRRLIFFSNYDGSWERYLGDFVDQAHVGLTAVWSNTVGFPRTKNLVQEGATDEEHFKNWTRLHQIPTQLWYSAYPQLTVPNVGRNSQICAGLLREPAGAEQLAHWLELL